MGGLLFPTPVTFQDTSRGDLFHAALKNIAFSVTIKPRHFNWTLPISTLTIHSSREVAWHVARGLATILATVLGGKCPPQPHVHKQAEGERL